MTKFSNRFKEALLVRGMRQTDVVSKTGLSKSLVSDYFNGRYEPKQNNLYIIAKALDVKESWLMGFEVEMQRDNEDYFVDDENSIISATGTLCNLLGSNDHEVWETVYHIISNMRALDISELNKLSDYSDLLPKTKNIL